jgi:serine kinase of HPr protein (carbohydrate metabolism regulator)
LRGLIEVRGLGIVSVDAILEAPLALVVDLVASDAVERLPDPRVTTIAGVSVPCLALDPFALSAPIKVALALLGRVKA